MEEHASPLKQQAFISYSTEDKKAAAITCSGLEAGDIKCWMAPRDIVPGQHYGEAVVTAIEASGAVVFLLSSNSNESPFVESELERAKSCGVVVITFRIENVEPSKKLLLFLSTLQWLDAYEKPFEKRIPSLMEAVCKVLLPVPKRTKPVSEGAETISARVEAVSRWVHHKRLEALRKRLGLGFAAAVVFFVAVWVVLHFISEPPLAISSFGILPLRDETGSSGQEFLGYEVAEELSDRLSALPYIKVVPSSALSGYSDSTHQYAQLGQRLKIDAVLVGRFYRQGDNLLVNASLVEAKTGRERWHQSYQRSIADIPEIAMDISQGISTVLGIPLPRSSADKLARVCTRSVGAYEAYLKGRYYKGRAKAEENALSIEYFREALQKDTSCVPALVGLADAQEYHFEQGWTTDNQFLSLAEENCRRALSLDTGSAGALVVLGAIEEQRGSNPAALERYEQANRHNPANTLVLTRMAWLYFNKLSDQTRAIKCLKRVEELEPFNTDNELNLGVMYAMLHRYREALESLRKVVELRPDESDYWHNLGYLYERVESPDSAMGAYAFALSLDNTRGNTYLSYAALALARGEVSRAESLLIHGKALVGDVRITSALGHAYAVDGRHNEADQTYREGLAVQEAAVRSNSATADDYALLGLFQARLGARMAAKASVSEATRRVQLNDDIAFLDIARVFAVLGEREQLLNWFGRAHTVRPVDYDEYFVRSTIDFEHYRTDPRLLAIARQ